MNGEREPVEGVVVPGGPESVTPEDVEDGVRHLIESSMNDRDVSDVPSDLLDALRVWVEAYMCWGRATAEPYLHGGTDPWLDRYRDRAVFGGDLDLFSHIAGWDEMGPVVGPHASSDAYHQQRRAEERQRAEEHAFIRDYLGVDLTDRQKRTMDYFRRRYAEPIYRPDAFVRYDGTGL
jgi:hypothetical protein